MLATDGAVVVLVVHLQHRVRTVPVSVQRDVVAVAAEHQVTIRRQQRRELPVATVVGNRNGSPRRLPVM